MIYTKWNGYILLTVAIIVVGWLANGVTHQT